MRSLLSGMPPHESSILELRGVSWISRREVSLPEGIQSVDFRVAPREITWLEGPVDEGKEAVFRLLSLAEIPEAGDVFVEGVSHQTMSGPQRAQVRAQRFGFVPTSPFFLPSFSAIENIAVPLLKISAVTLEEAQDRIARVLRFVGLVGKEESAADQLEGLDQARLALARALANQPLALFVEDLEATLQPDELAEFFATLRRATETYGVSVIALCGANSARCHGERVVQIANGRVQRDSALVASTVE
jgi:ABC-type ATPase involved in cell division